ncbi:ETC complex I subunit [Chelativorans sp. AA-79]|uniref:ETC complex I subunit n=1 Tax=Chelativorans sp. AA-79 TaxID=3028735 RepID=UPI0023F7A105|nr:ETC complex I subunit [Chelativorans sp. AA-79]WEX07499.1 ETC complex I subunit [Chelativorans sp. AA-79]
MSARIYSPSRTAMQSGTAKTGQWVLEFEPETPLKIDPLMGYTSSSDTRRQVHLSFPTKEEAIAYAQRNGIAYRVEPEKAPHRRQVSYAENFRYDRKIPWTH